MVRVRKDYEERRKELLDIAFKLFCSKGYEKTMVEDITADAGVAKGTFFYYYSTKEAVLIAICERWVKEFAKRFHIESINYTAIDKLELFLHLFDESSDLDLLIDKLYEEDQLKLFQRLWKSQVENVLNPILKEVIQQGLNDKSMRVIDIDNTVDFFWSILNCLWDIDRKDNNSKNEMIRYQLAEEMIVHLLSINSGELNIRSDKN